MTFNFILFPFLIDINENIFSVGKNRLNNFLNNPDKKFDEIIYNIIFLSILIPHFLLPIASWRHGPEVAKFKNMWTHYQVTLLYFETF